MKETLKHVTVIYKDDKGKFSRMTHAYVKYVKNMNLGEEALVVVGNDNGYSITYNWKYVRSIEVKEYENEVDDHICFD